MEKLTDKWFETTINDNRVFLLGVNTFYHDGFEVFITVRPQKPWNSDSVWWSLSLTEKYEGKPKIIVTKYESDKMRFSGNPDWEDRVEVTVDELNFWKTSKSLKKLIEKILNQLENELKNDKVSFNIKNNHRDFSETRKIVDKALNNFEATKV